MALSAIRISASLALWLVALTPAFAQEQSGDRDKPEPKATQAPAEPERPLFGRERHDDQMSIAGLFQVWKVRDVLKLSLEDHKAVCDAIEEASPRVSSLRTRLRDANTWVANGTAPQETLDAVKAALAEAEAKRLDAIRKRISPAQFDRLMQIAIQRRGFRSLTMPEVAAALELAPEQREAILSILADRKAERAVLLDRLLARIPPADQRRYDEMARRMTVTRAARPEDAEFSKRWFAAHRERYELLEKFEDQTDVRIFNVLNRYQKRRFRNLVGDIVDIEGMPPASPDQPTQGRPTP